MIKKGWMWLLTLFLGSLPAMAFAGQTVHASQFLRPLVIIGVVLLILIGLLWCLKYWASDIPAPIGKILTFVFIAVAVIIIVIVLLGLAGIRIV